jgi:hypothetical protein
MGAASFFFIGLMLKFRTKKKIERTAGIATKKTIFAAKFNNKNT